MKAPSPHFTSSTQGVAALRQLLAHDRRRDQRDALHGRRHVAQGVELLVGRGERGRLADDAGAHVAQRRLELVDGQVDAKARNRLQLVERAAGVAEPAARHLGHGHAAGRGQRRQHNRHLVADAARAVLADLDAGHVRQVDPLARPHHGVGQPGGLLGRHAPPDDGHQQRRQLIVGDRRVGRPLDERLDRLGGERQALSLAGDHVDKRHREDGQVHLLWPRTSRIRHVSSIGQRRCPPRTAGPRDAELATLWTFLSRASQIPALQYKGRLPYASYPISCLFQSVQSSLPRSARPAPSVFRRSWHSVR